VLFVLSNLIFMDGYNELMY